MSTRSEFGKLASNIPILVGAGQSVERVPSGSSPMDLAGRASVAALADCGAKDVASHIDTIAAVRIFSDSTERWASDFGRSNNPPESIARFIGAQPQHRIYTQPGGNEPLSRIIEFARDIALGERSVVLLAGGEAIRNQRTANRRGIDLDWGQNCDEPLEDRGVGDFELSDQELANGLVMPVFFYTLIEQLRLGRSGLDRNDYLNHLGQLLESFSAVASENPYAQFPGAMSTREILSAEPMTHLYTKRMVAQDGTNQGAALLLTSVGKARQLGIPESHWVFLHGAAEGEDVALSKRPDPGTSAVAVQVLDRTLGMAAKKIVDVELIDIYSAFSSAVTSISDHLGLPADGSVPLTVTGGLPYFGGPGSTYGLNALAEMVRRLRCQREAFGLVTNMGGVLSKHCASVLSCQPSTIDWCKVDARVGPSMQKHRTIVAQPRQGRVVSYAISYQKGEPSQGIVLAETEARQRFFCSTTAEDLATVRQMLEIDPTGRAVSIIPGQREHSLHFTLKAT